MTARRSSRKMWNDWRKSRNPSVRILQKTQRLSIGPWTLWQQRRTVRFHKTRGIFWWSERLTACAGLFSMNLARHRREQNKEYGRYTGGVEVLNPGTGRWWPAVDCRAPLRKERWNPWNRRLCGPHSREGRVEPSPPPPKKTRTVSTIKEPHISTGARLRRTANWKSAAS